MELQNWDGTKQRAISGQSLDPLEVANISTTTIVGAPVLFVGVKPAAAWLRQLPSGRTAKFLPPSADGLTPDLLDLKTEGVTWSCIRKDGNLFDRIQTDQL